MADVEVQGGPTFASAGLLAGKYRVERVLGAGAMGVVLAAHHLQPDEKVAVSSSLPEALDNSEAVAHFAREARAREDPSWQSRSPGSRHPRFERSR